MSTYSQISRKLHEGKDFFTGVYPGLNKVSGPQVAHGKCMFNKW